MNRARGIISVLILAMVLVGSLIAMGCSAGRNPTGVPEIGNLAPDFQLDNLDGQSVSLSDYRGKPVLVNFWATWCVPCRSEMPLIQNVFADKKWADEGLVVLAIAIGASPASIGKFVEKHGLTFPVLLDSKQDVFREYYAFAPPTTFFIDREGIIREIKVGPFSSSSEIERSLREICKSSREWGTFETEDNGHSSP